MKLAPAQYRFPAGMRPATVRERREFYQREFSLDAVKRWFWGWRYPIVFATVIGRHTRIYPWKYRRHWKETVLIDEYADLGELRRYLVDFCPESAYYDRNLYASWDQARSPIDKLKGLGRDFGQQMAFDVDPENFDCPIHGTLSEKMERRQGLSFCRLELQLAKQQAGEMMDSLSNTFSELCLVYSGRGFHIHVFDEDTFYWPRKRRLKLVRSLTKLGFAMDEWVAAGGMRLIRLPYSLNALVSRIAIPLRPGELDRFDPAQDRRCRPRFLIG